MKVKDKIEIFCKTALKDADDKRRQLSLELDEEYRKACGEMTAKADKAFGEVVREETYKAAQEKNRRLLQATTEAKRSLIDLRAQLIDELFAGVAAKLADYAAQDSYYEELVAEVGKTAALYEGGITVCLCERDMGRAEQLKAINGVDVEQGGNDMIGGFTARVKGKNILIDRSYRARLAEAREAFGGFKIME